MTRHTPLDRHYTKTKPRHKGTRFPKLPAGSKVVVQPVKAVRASSVAETIKEMRELMESDPRAELMLGDDDD